MTSIRFVGMDVHKDSVNIAVLDHGKNELTFEKQLSNDRARIGREMRRLAEGYTLLCCYEAGPCGYELKRFLDKMKVECVVAAPGLIPRRPTDRVKTDRRDAEKIVRMLRAGEIEPVHVLAPESEAVRDLVRCRDDVREDYLRRRLRLSAFLLRHGKVYRGSPWTQKHTAWLKALPWELPALQETFEQYWFAVDEARERLKRCDDLIDGYAGMEPWKTAVDILGCFRGIATLTGIALVSEVEDFRRFPHPRNFMSYLGLTASEYSSGNKRIQGAITKTGNKQLRRMLIEAAWHYRHKPLVSAHLAKRREGKPEWAIRLADKANDRLTRRYHRMMARGKSKNKVVTAIARELAGFIWASQVHGAAA